MSTVEGSAYNTDRAIVNARAPERILLIDALRGIAAMAVVLFHYGERIGWDNWGNMGVPMFFVLSGFVIAMSVGTRPPLSLGFLGRFALRRALRLDPPYWLSIGAVIVIGLVGARYGVKHEPTSFGEVMAHLFYLQGFLKYEDIQVIYWTLCYEIQFYLALILLLWVGRTFGITGPLMFGTLALSLMDRHFEVTADAFMGRFWFCFGIGAMVYWTTQGRMRTRHLLLALAMVGTFGALRQGLYSITATITATALFLALAFGRADLGSSRPLQFLGRISYSLYLTHLIGGWLVLSVALKFLPAWPAFALGVVASVLSAWVFHILVEAPAARMSRVVKVKREDEG